MSTTHEIGSGWWNGKRYEDVDVRGDFIRTFDGKRCRYYWRGVRVPWLAWVMFF